MMWWASRAWRLLSDRLYAYAWYLSLVKFQDTNGVRLRYQPRLLSLRGQYSIALADRRGVSGFS